MKLHGDEQHCIGHWVLMQWGWQCQRVKYLEWMRGMMLMLMLLVVPDECWKEVEVELLLSRDVSSCMKFGLMSSINPYSLTKMLYQEQEQKHAAQRAILRARFKITSYAQYLLYYVSLSSDLWAVQEQEYNWVLYLLHEIFVHSMSKACNSMSMIKSALAWYTQTVVWSWSSSYSHLPPRWS